MSDKAVDKNSKLAKDLAIEEKNAVELLKKFFGPKDK